MNRQIIGRYHSRLLRFTIYRDAEIHVNTGGRKLQLLPYDYVGESQSAPGRYSYVLGIQGDRLTIDLEKAD